MRDHVIRVDGLPRRAAALLLLGALLLALSGCPPTPDDREYRNDTTNADAADGSAEGEGTEFQAVSAKSKALAPAAGEAAITLRTFTPTAAFRGNQVALVAGTLDTPTTNTSSILVREADCSLTQFAITPVNAPATSITAMLSGAHIYLHQLAGLTTTPGRFPRGCVDRRLGQVSSRVAFLGRNTAGELLSVVVDFNGGITIVRVSTQGVALGRTTLVTSGAALTVSTADFNGDGIGDIVSPFVVSGERRGIGVFLSRADGGFEPVAIYTGYTTDTSRFSTATSIEDLNGDGRLDIVAVDRTFVEATFPTVVTLLGAPGGNFTAGSVSRPAIDTGPMLLADFTGDGRVDLMTSGGALAPGNGDGTFGTAVQRLNALTSGFGQNIVAGDFDADGKLDVALASGSYITLFRGGGDGTFTAGATYVAIRGADNMNVTDLDGDGNLDIVVGLASQGVYGADDRAESVVQFLFGKGDGSLVGAQGLPGMGLSLESGAPTFALADFTGDGFADIVSTPPNGADGHVLLQGSASADFAAPAVVPGATGRAFLVTSGDFDGDGRQDVVSNDSSLTVRLGRGAGTFAAARSVALPSGTGDVVNIATGDVNGDGRADALVVRSGQGTRTGGAFLYLAEADGSLRAPVQLDSATNIGAAAMADLNADGRADIVLGGRDPLFFGPDRIVGARVYRGNADGSVSSPLALAVGNAVTALAIGDMNEDGRPDLVAATADAGLNGTLAILPGAGDGSFGTAVTLALARGGPGVQSLAIADYSGDGHADVLLGGGAHSSIVRGTGTGAFGTITAITIASRVAYLKGADLNSDGKVDAVAAIGQQGLVPLVRTRSALADVTPPAPEPFMFTASSSSGSAMSGQGVSTTLSFAFAAGFAETVTLSCGALPANTLCEFSPASVTGSAGGASSVLTIRTGTAGATMAAAAFDSDAPGGAGDARQSPLQPTVLAWLFAAAVQAGQRRDPFALNALRSAAGRNGSSAAPRRTRRRIRTVIGIALLAALVTVAGCGGNGGDGDGGPVAPAPRVTPSGTYDITVTATAPSSTRTFTYRLTVQ